MITPGRINSGSLENPIHDHDEKRRSEGVALQDASIHTTLIGQAIFREDLDWRTPVERKDSRDEVRGNAKLDKRVEKMNTVERLIEINESQFCRLLLVKGAMFHQTAESQECAEDTSDAA